MKASDTSVDTFLASNRTTFAIPVYQRNYDWKLAQCRQLLSDILAVGGDQKLSAHFIGSIVYVHDDVYSASRLKELTIIDGQQRLTTLTLVFIALYRHAIETGQEQWAQLICETYLINRFAEKTEKLKLKPTDSNRAAPRQIMDPKEAMNVSGFSRLTDNFKFFQGEINDGNFDKILRGRTCTAPRAVRGPISLIASRTTTTAKLWM